MNRIIIIIFSILIFYIVFVAFSDFSKISNSIDNFRFELIPIILLLTFSGFIILGIRQNFLLNDIGIKISLKENIKLYLSGLSMIITPGGAGQLIKSFYLKKKYNYETSKTLPLVFVERFLDLISITTLIILSLLFVQNFEVLFMVIIMTSIIIVSVLTLRFKKLFKFFIRNLSKISFLKKFIENMNESYDSLHNMTSVKSILRAWLIGMISFSFEALAIYTVFIAFRVDLGFFNTISIIYPSIVYGVLSLIPGGVGLTEWNVVRLLTKDGITVSLSSAIILAVRFFTIWFATITGFIATKFFLKNN